MSDGSYNSSYANLIPSVYNHTTFANLSMYNAYSKFWYNMSDGVGGDYNYNETTIVKSYVDNNYLPRNGTLNMTGNLQMGWNNITFSNGMSIKVNSTTMIIG
jgi:hypothetical protein